MCIGSAIVASLALRPPPTNDNDNRGSCHLKRQNCSTAAQRDEGGTLTIVKMDDWMLVSLRWCNKANEWQKMRIILARSEMPIFLPNYSQFRKAWLTGHPLWVNCQLHETINCSNTS